MKGYIVKAILRFLVKNKLEVEKPQTGEKRRSEN